MCNTGPIRGSACMGTHTHVRPSALSMQQSCPQCWPAAEVAASPPPKGHTASQDTAEGASSTVWKTRKQTRSPSSACSASSRTRCLPGGGDRASSSETRKRAAAVPAPLCPLTSQAREGRDRGREGRDGQGDSTPVGGAAPFQTACPPPNHSHLDRASRSVHF